MDTSKIKSGKLRQLIESSEKFNKLPAKEQERYVELMADAQGEAEDELCAFFANENTVEEAGTQTDQSKTIKALEALDKQMTELEKAFGKCVRDDKEYTSKDQDAKEMDNLINQLDKTK